MYFVACILTCDFLCVKDAEAPVVEKVAAPQLNFFVRRYNWPQKSYKDPIPIRIMTLTESELLYPDVPHSWLCEGRLLRLMAPNHPGNKRIFQVRNAHDSTLGCVLTG